VLASYHNHTRWSDGRSSIEELVATAQRMHLGHLGISDHYVLHPEGRVYDWSIAPDQLGAYVEALETAARDAPAGLVRVGLEVDWFSDHHQALREALAPFSFDYLIGSVHEVDGIVIDGSPRVWERMSQEQRNDVHRRYWVLLRELAASGLVDIIAHMDLAKKFGYLPTVDLRAEIDEALDAIADTTLVVELNTAGWHKPVDDAYPTLEILRACRKRDIPVTLSADAHDPAHLLRDFQRGAQRLREAGYEEVARFEQRTVRMEPIEAAVP
jgi:histidinol-phosphatase (PHP family)